MQKPPRFLAANLGRLFSYKINTCVYYSKIQHLFIGQNAILNNISLEHGHNEMTNIFIEKTRKGGNQKLVV